MAMCPTSHSIQGPTTLLSMVGQRLQVCRFSDAGSDEASTCSGGRCLKSAKARNRGKWGTVGAAGSMGIWPRCQVGRGWSEHPPQFLCLAGWVWVTGRTSAAGVGGQCWRCHCGPIYRPAVSGGYAGRAGQNGERHWGGGSVVRHYEVLIL